MLGRAVLARAGAFEAGQIARGLDHRHVQAVADAEERHLALAREFHRAHLAFGAALAETARHQDAVDVLEERGRVVALEDLAVDPVHMDLHIVGDAAMGQRLAQRFVGILHLHVLADDGDAHLAFRVLHPLHDLCPAREIGLGRVVDVEVLEQLRVEADLVIGERHTIDRVEVERGDHPLRRHVAEQADLAPVVLGNRMRGAAQQDIRLDADGPQLLHRMLRRLGLQLPRRIDIGHQRQMDEGRVIAAEIVAELADRLEERQAFDVADRAADLDQQEVEILDAGENEFLDHVGDVRDHLHGAAEIEGPCAPSR